MDNNLLSEIKIYQLMLQNNILIVEILIFNIIKNKVET